MNKFNRKRYPFSNEIKQAIKRECSLDNWHAPLAILGIYFRIVLSIAFPYVLSNLLSSESNLYVDYVWWFAYALSVVCIGFWQRALARVVHESAHKVLTKSPFFGKFLGTFASGYLILQGWYSYFNTHIKGHHLYLGDDKYDPDLAYHQSLGLYDEAQSQAAFVWKNLIAPLLFFRTPSKIADLLINRLLAANEPVIEKISKFVFIGGIACFSIALDIANEFLLFWIAPLVFAFPVVNWYIELFEHFPLVKDSDVDLYMTRNRWTGMVGKILTGTFNENFHQVHHLFPAVPFWKLGVVHKILMQDESYAATQSREVGLVFPVIYGIPSIVGGLVRRGKS